MGTMTRILQTFFIFFALYLVVLNTFSLYKEIRVLGQIRQRVPFIFMGNKFLGLEGILKNAERIGYYTDKDLDVNQPALQFAQAQYVLAPIILELNNPNHLFILFDCTTEETAMKKIQEAGLKPIKKNQFGIILAGNPAKVQPKSKPRMRVPLWNQ